MANSVQSSGTTSASRSPLPNESRKDAVVLFGEVLADIFPERTVLGGAPFNVARHLKVFGLYPVLITCVGNDALRDEVLGEMSKYGMETLGVQFNNSYQTGRVQVHIDDGGHRFEILDQQAYDFIHPTVGRMATLSSNPALVYFGTLAQRHYTSRRALNTLLHSTGALKFLDINLRVPWYDEKILRQSLKFADIVKLNDDELRVLAEMFGLPGINHLDWVKELISQFQLEQVLVTCGEKGAWCINRDGNKSEACLHKKSINMVDTVGAGDGFAAVYILGAMHQWPIETTLERANSFAAALCEIRGAVPDHVDFYKPFVEEWGI